MVGFAIALIALLIVAAILWARVNEIGERCREIVVNPTSESDQTMMETIVDAQHSLNNLHELVKKTNITILRIFSIIIGKAPKVLFQNIQFLQDSLPTLNRVIVISAASESCDVGNDCSSSPVGGNTVQVYSYGANFVLVHS